MGFCEFRKKPRKKFNPKVGVFIGLVRIPTHFCHILMKKFQLFRGPGPGSLGAAAAAAAAAAGLSGLGPWFSLQSLYIANNKLGLRKVLEGLGA